MARNKSGKIERPIAHAAKRAAGPGTSVQINLGYDPSGPTRPVDIVSSKDGWSEYTLIDGTVIRTKAAVLDVKIAVGQYNAEGDPIYIVQAAVINQAIVKDELKRKK